ncbi:hypothetical protein Tco_0551690, partial [Tanacetum coccineum]
MFPQRHVAGGRFPQRHVADEGVRMLLGKGLITVVKLLIQSDDKLSTSVSCKKQNINRNIVNLASADAGCKAKAIVGGSTNSDTEGQQQVLRANVLQRLTQLDATCNSDTGDCQSSGYTHKFLLTLSDMLFQVLRKTARKGYNLANYKIRELVGECHEIWVPDKLVAKAVDDNSTNKNDTDDEEDLYDDGSDCDYFDNDYQNDVDYPLGGGWIREDQDATKKFNDDSDETSHCADNHQNHNSRCLK